MNSAVIKLRQVSDIRRINAAYFVGGRPTVYTAEATLDSNFKTCFNASILMETELLSHTGRGEPPSGFLPEEGKCVIQSSRRRTDHRRKKDKRVYECIAEENEGGDQGDGSTKAVAQYADPQQSADVLS